MTSTSDYYNVNANEFFDSTNDVDVSPLYQQFLKRLPANGHILDAGCGSGRDSRAFMNLGFSVTAFDASPALVELAIERNHVSAEVATFESFTVEDETFDGIWACASILHVLAKDVQLTIDKLAKALKMDGNFYLSFKYGSGERNVTGRHFTDLDEESLRNLLANLPNLQLVKFWLTDDARPDRKEQWLNVILQKT